MAAGTSFGLADQIRTLTEGYKIIDPDEYQAQGIDPAEIPLGTVASKNHPDYLLSRFGGNAFGLGLFEQTGRLGEEEARLLSELDLDDPEAVAAQASKINALYKRLGLFVRYSARGRPYYLIPLTWLAHSTAEVHNRAEEIERQVQTLVKEHYKERLSILLLTPSEDLVAAELTWRLANHRLTLIPNLADLTGKSGPFDLAILTKDVVSFILDDQPEVLVGRRLTRAVFNDLGLYLMGRIYDLLAAGGRLLVLAPRAIPPGEEDLTIRFREERELKNFFLFAHLFKTLIPYHPPPDGGAMTVRLHDLANFLTQKVVSRRMLTRLTKRRAPTELTLEEIDGLPHLGRPPQAYPFPDQQAFWARLMEPFFEPSLFKPHRLAGTRAVWAERFDLSCEAPATEMIFVGNKREGALPLKELESEVRRRGLSGCPAGLLADYKDSFAYLPEVLEVVEQIRDNRFIGLPVHQLARLRKPLDEPRGRAGFFKDVLALLKARPKLARLAKGFNPFGLEGGRTPVLANLEKLSLLGLEPELLREILLILVDHSTMNRITLGKLPEKSLSRLTDYLAGQDQAKVVETIRAVRLMSLAEMAALEDGPPPQARIAELFTLSDESIRAAADPAISWAEINEDRISAAGGETNWAVRRMLKLFGLFEHIDDWMELTRLGPYEKESLADYQPAARERLEAVVELVNLVERFKDRFACAPSPARPYFFRRFLELEFHGTARLLPALGPGLGFKLLWLAGNASPAVRVNFNPLTAGKKTEEGLAELCRALAGLEMDALNPDYLFLLQGELTPGGSAFVHDSGLRLALSRRGTLNVSFVDVEADLNRLKELTQSAVGQTISDLLPAELKEMDRLFGRLDDYVAFMERPAIKAQREAAGRSDFFPVQAKKFHLATQRVKEALVVRLFRPEVLGEHITRLDRLAPRLLAFLIPELAEMAALPPVHPDHPGQSMLVFFKRAAVKFQALASHRAEEFQDEGALHRLAIQEFGLNAAGGIGLNSEQMDLLQKMADRLKRRRYLLRAIGVGLLFQDLARLPSIQQRFKKIVGRSAHGPAGARLLVGTGLLDRYPLSPQTKEAVVFLAHHHGLLARLVRGEAPLTLLAEVTDPGDEEFLDAFFLHNLLSLASAREGLLTEDLMGFLLTTRSQALKVLAGQASWDELARTERARQGAAVCALARLESQPGPVGPEEFGELVRQLETELEEARLEGEGAAAAGMERLYRLMGLWFLSYEAVALFKLKVPVSYIRQKLDLRSLGQAGLEKALFEAVRLEKEGLDLLPAGIRGYLLQGLADLDRPVVLHGLAFVAEYLGGVNRLRAILVGLRAADCLGGSEAGPVTVSYLGLERVIKDRHEFVNEALAGIELDRLMKSKDGVEALFGERVGIKVGLHAADRLVTVSFADAIVPDRFRRIAADILEPGQLAQAFHDRLRKLRAQPHNTRVYEVGLESIYEDRLAEISAEQTEAAIADLLGRPNLASLFEAYQGLFDRPEIFSLSQIQRQRIDNALAVRREQLRRQWEANVLRRLDDCRNAEALEALWQTIRQEMMPHRRLLGRELERETARHFDARRNQFLEQTD